MIKKLFEMLKNTYHLENKIKRLNYETLIADFLFL